MLHQIDPFLNAVQTPDRGRRTTINRRYQVIHIPDHADPRNRHEVGSASTLGRAIFLARVLAAGLPDGERIEIRAA